MYNTYTNVHVHVHVCIYKIRNWYSTRHTHTDGDKMGRGKMGLSLNHCRVISDG